MFINIIFTPSTITMWFLSLITVKCRINQTIDVVSTLSDRHGIELSPESLDKKLAWAFCTNSRVAWLSRFLTWARYQNIHLGLRTELGNCRQMSLWWLEKRWISSSYACAGSIYLFSIETWYHLFKLLILSNVTECKSPALVFGRVQDKPPRWLASPQVIRIG